MDQLIQYWRIYKDLIPMVIVGFLIVVLVFSIILFFRVKKKQTDSFKRTALDFLISLNVISICFITLYPTGIKENHFMDFSFSINGMKTQGIESIINVLLFLPLAYCCSFRIKSKNKYYIILCLAIFSILIEAFQYVLPIGRIATLNDIVLNSVGAAIGVIIAKLYTMVINKQHDDIRSR